MIERILIKNFKTIANLDLNCKKINVFIGRPNVGKSNILEAMGLLCPENNDNKVPFKNIIRYKQASNLFRDDNINEIISVETNLGGAYLYSLGKYVFDLTNIKENFISETAKLTANYFNSGYKKEINMIKLANNLVIDDSYYKNAFNILKKYEFKQTDFNELTNENSLHFPNGKNLFEMIFKNPVLRKEFGDIFADYGLKLAYRRQDHTFELQKEIDNIIDAYPYEHSADTLQRLIFYLTAIATNQNTTLVFEEPETHAFPPYIRTLAQRIANDTSNQYFLTTHSPYMLDLLIENVPFEDLNVCVVRYEDYQTEIRTLEQHEIDSILNNATDVFLNMYKFEKPIYKPVENE